VELEARAEVVRLSDAQASEAVLDPAKGLRLLCDVVERTIAKNKGRPRSAALLAVSIDNMQPVRDFGPTTVEPVFIGLAGRMRECLRASDFVARLADDQLGIVLPYFRFNGASIALKRIMALRSKPLTTPYGAINLKLSFATVLFPDENLTAADVITRAQATLAYHQTRNGDELELTRSMREQVTSIRRA
jgi:GGDEF domain-containing protein